MFDRGAKWVEFGVSGIALIMERGTCTDILILRQTRAFTQRVETVSKLASRFGLWLHCDQHSRRAIFAFRLENTDEPMQSKVAMAVTIEIGISRQPETGLIDAPSLQRTAMRR
jgi:hypothetical protein